MKAFITFVGIMVAVAAAEKVTYKMPQDVADKVKKYAAPCADENNLDHSVILKLPAGTVPDTEAGKKFVYCFAKAIGYITDDGHMVTDKLADILKDHPLKAQFKEALDQCNQVTKDNPLDTVLAMNKCFAERPPIRVVF